jgi:hypothetical protein
LRLYIEVAITTVGIEIAAVSSASLVRTEVGRCKLTISKPLVESAPDFKVLA